MLLQPSFRMQMQEIREREVIPGIWPLPKQRAFNSDKIKARAQEVYVPI